MTAAPLILIAAIGAAQPSTSGTSPRPVGAAPMPLPGTRPLTAADLERVAAGPADINTLGATLRSAPADTRVQTDFSGLFRIPTTARTKYAGWYAREQGGVLAVFPQSVYNIDQDGRPQAVVPPGTVFMVGGIPQDDARRDNRSTSPSLNLSASSRDGAESPAPAPVPSRRLVSMSPAQVDEARRVTIESIVADDDFAAARVSHRLREALGQTAGSPAPAAATTQSTEAKPAADSALPAAAPASPATGWRQTTKAPADPPAPTPAPAESPAPAKPAGGEPKHTPRESE